MFSRQKQYLNHRNSLLMILSNYSLPLTLYIMPIRLTLELVAMVYSLFCLDMNHFLGIMQSLFWVFNLPHIIWKRRRIMKKIRLVNDKQVLQSLYWGSIVFDYYIRRKKLSADIVNE